MICICMLPYSVYMLFLYYEYVFVCMYGSISCYMLTVSFFCTVATIMREWPLGAQGPHNDDLRTHIKEWTLTESNDKIEKWQNQAATGLKSGTIEKWQNRTATESKSDRIEKWPNRKVTESKSDRIEFMMWLSLINGHKVEANLWLWRSYPGLSKARCSYAIWITFSWAKYLRVKSGYKTI